MINKAIKFLIITIIVALALYVVNINSSPLTVALTHSHKFTSNAGLILIGSFLLGFIFSAFIATFFGIRAFFREKKLLRREKQQKTFYGEMIKARALSVAGLWPKAEEAWSRLIKKDPSDVIARSELAECLIQNQKYKEALKVLDDARGFDSQNPEILLKAADLNIKLNNKTAAIDNLALLLYHHPSAYVAGLSRDLSEELNRIDDALEYHRRFMQMSTNSQENQKILARLEYKKLLEKREQEYKEDPSETRNHKKHIKENKAFVKRFPDHAPAIYDLAKEHEAIGEVERAAQFMVSAARITSNPAYWQEAAKLWIDNNLADNALLVISAVVKESRGIKKLDAQVVYIKTLIALNKLEDAKNELDHFNSFAKENDLDIPGDIARDILILKGLCLNRMALYKESAQIWKKLSKHDHQLEFNFEDEASQQKNTTEAPEPMFSTP